MLPLSSLSKIQQTCKPEEFATSSCLAPRRIKIRMSETGDLQDMYVPCGKCLRCLDNRRNELASRMFVHSLDYEFCYYVTLTYGSYNLLPFKQHPFLADWLQTIPLYHANNSTKKPCWCPTLLVTQHLNKFLKRLRIQLGNPFSYAGCGEYGDDYCRPHFHLILWSHTPISYESIKLAWSLECKRTSDKYVIHKWRESIKLKSAENGYFRFSLGRVDYNDLWANGSLNYDGKHCGNVPFNPNNNAMHNFTYVAKYIGKSDPFTYLSNRPLWFIENIHIAYSLYQGNSDRLAELLPNPTYELQLYNLIQNSYNYEENNFSKIDFIDFKKIISPFFVSSRRPSIGKYYYLQNRDRILSKTFAMPKFRGKSVQVPTYFYRLAQLDQFPIRLRKICPSGVSPSKDLLPRIYTYFSALRQDKNIFYTLQLNNLFSSQSFTKRLYNYSLTDSIHNPYTDYIRHHSNTLDSIDFVGPGNKVIHYVYDPYFEVFEGYSYNDVIKEYERIDIMERLDFCDFVLESIEKEYERYPKKLENLQNLTLIYDCILESPDSQTNIEKYISLREDISRKYKLTKQKLF